MYHRLKRLPFLAGVSVLALSAAPALAQECQQEIDRYDQRIAGSDLSEDRKNQARAQLEEARTAQQNGAEQACRDAIAGLQVLIPEASAEEPASTEETVEATAELEVEQAQPQVTVRQKPPRLR